MDYCVYEAVHGDNNRDCNGACNRGKDSFCPYYNVDKVWHIMNDWRRDARVTTPIIWRWDSRRNKVCLYTTHPGYFIGKSGERYQRFVKLLCEADPEKFKENGVDIIQCDDSIGD